MRNESGRPFEGDSPLIWKWVPYKGPRFDSDHHSSRRGTAYIAYIKKADSLCQEARFINPSLA